MLTGFPRNSNSISRTQRTDKRPGLAHWAHADPGHMIATVQGRAFTVYLLPVRAHCTGPASTVHTPPSPRTSALAHIRRLGLSGRDSASDGRHVTSKWGAAGVSEQCQLFFRSNNPARWLGILTSCQSQEPVLNSVARTFRLISAAQSTSGSWHVGSPFPRNNLIRFYLFT